MKDPRHILITGASSGIGEALAGEYADAGIRLSLSGRNKDRLQAVAGHCRSRGAVVDEAVVDVCDATAMREWITACWQRQPIDLIVANAGIALATGGAEEMEERTRKIFAVNVDGVLNTIFPALPAMCERQRGQIAIVSSLAGFRGMPSAPAYSASKAAVRALGEGLRGRLAPKGIEVNVVAPGFVKSRITADNSFPMPFLMEAEAAARRIRRGLARNQGRIAFPRRLYAVIWLLSCLPDALAGRLLGGMPKK